MSGRHGGGILPNEAQQMTQLRTERHGGGYRPGSEQASSPTTSNMAATPRFASPPMQYAQQAQTSPYQAPAMNASADYQRAPASDEAMLTSGPTERYTSETVDDRRAVDLRGARNLRHPMNRWRLQYPSAHLRPTWSYDDTRTYINRDALTRQWEGPPDDRYISPLTGHVMELVVQATDEIYNGPGHTTYMRTYIRNMSPIMLRIATWPTLPLDFLPGKMENRDVGWVIAKWLPSCLALALMLLFPGDASGQERNHGRYDVFPYRYYGYPKAARNASEDVVPAPFARRPTDTVNPVAERALRPRYLCSLQEDDSVKIVDVEQWDAQHPSTTLDYVFIAYTTEHFRHDSNSDMDALHRIAKRATRDAGLTAYWIGCSCMPDSAELEQDVYRISDVVRGAQSLAIATGLSGRAKTTEAHVMLKQWGKRMWTYPEVLLSPGDRIRVYVRDSNDVQVLLKRQFAAKVWSDAATSRQLIDHYEQTLTLGPLELVTLALKCLHSRETSEYLPGDHSYALMGLVRLRPKIDKTDTAFQAFARLSLANNSDMLLERLICTLPRNPEQHWSCMDDAWNVNLWDIYPKCQIAGIGHDDTVIIDGLRAANVRWKSFQRVRNVTRATLKRKVMQGAWHSAPLFLYTGIGLVANGQAAAGGVLLAYSLVMILLAPYIMRVLYSGKFWYTQPWLFGFEGHMNIETIERQIFGAHLGRLNWAPASSPLSRHYMNEHGECVGLDPIRDPATKLLVDQAVHARPGDQRIFTIVDTGAMEVTLFQAKRPPVAFLVAGEEGGMQRAIGVSYQWETATCYRETVLRMQTPWVEMMDRCPRVRFGLKREMMPVKPVGMVQSV